MIQIKLKILSWIGSDKMSQIESENLSQIGNGKENRCSGSLIKPKTDSKWIGNAEANWTRIAKL